MEARHVKFSALSESEKILSIPFLERFLWYDDGSPNFRPFLANHSADSHPMTFKLYSIDRARKTGQDEPKK